MSPICAQDAGEKSLAIRLTQLRCSSCDLCAAKVYLLGGRSRARNIASNTQCLRPSKFQTRISSETMTSLDSGARELQSSGSKILIIW